VLTLHSSKVFDMNNLLEAVCSLVVLIPPEKVAVIAARIREIDVGKLAPLLRLFGTPVARAAAEQLGAAWSKTTVTSDELASMLLASCHIYNKNLSEQSVQLVWTGPTTPFVSARRTEQALLEVINSAQRALFITSFVAYDVSSIVNALNAAGERGVNISMLLELSQDHGGNITFDALGKMRELVPLAQLYAWRNKESTFANGSVHAKVAVADESICFITSANLTGYAMEKNMEAGLLLTGGHIPESLMNHLNSLIDTNVIKEI
jgi:phosphatidylserine/phosphatidylglycerophosphate/cardiolipin synthase-like enzyme